MHKIRLGYIQYFSFLVSGTAAVDAAVDAANADADAVPAEEDAATTGVPAADTKDTAATNSTAASITTICADQHTNSQHPAAFAVC